MPDLIEKLDPYDAMVTRYAQIKRAKLEQDGRDWNCTPRLLASVSEIAASIDAKFNSAGCDVINRELGFTRCESVETALSFKERPGYFLRNIAIAHEMFLADQKFGRDFGGMA